MRGLAVLICALCAVPVWAADFNWGDLTIKSKATLSFGAALRTEDPDTRLIGKLNVPGQQNLCPDDCLSFTGDTSPNERLVKARGAFFGSNKDNGDLNYRRWGVTSAVNKISEELVFNWNDWTVKLGGLAFFDPVNAYFDERHTDTRYQPPRSSRIKYLDRELGEDAQLKDALVATHFNLLDHAFHASLGYQHIHWGESSYVALNSLNEINPPDARLLHQPGGPINEVFRPTFAAVLGSELANGVNLDLLYMPIWQAAVPDPEGSFFSSVDVARGRYAMLSLGQFSEDPNGVARLPSPAGLISSTSTTARVQPDSFGDPHHSAQLGAKLTWYSEDINNGTEISLYGLRYNSRLPYVSATASAQSCARNSPNFAQAAIDCRGFRGSVGSLLSGLEPLPIDTATIFLDYPSDIQMYGMSFNTNVGKWSLAGEYSIRPQLPVQVDVPDVIFAALQPAFPKVDIPLLLPAVPLATIPGSRTAVPDFISRYQGYTVQPGQMVHGYQRLTVDQFDLTAIRALGSSDNPFMADQVIFLTEAGFTHVWGMPDRSRLQLEGGDNNDTHASPGADGTGSNGVPNPSRLNPTQQHSGFASDFAAGYRLLVRLQYDNLFWGVNVIPQVFFSHDVTGIGIQPMQNFIAGTKEFVVGSMFEYGTRWSGQIYYQGWTGGRSVDTLRDRDFLALAVGYSF